MEDDRSRALERSVPLPVGWSGDDATERVGGEIRPLPTRSRAAHQPGLPTCTQTPLNRWGRKSAGLAHLRINCFWGQISTISTGFLSSINLCESLVPFWEGGHF